MGVALVVVLIMATPLLAYSFVLFDRLVRAEYTEHRKAWEADGRPRGFFWTAPECTGLRSRWAAQRLSLLWLFSAPTWAVTAHRGLLTRFRTCVLAWNVSCLGLLAIWWR